MGRPFGHTSQGEVTPEHRSRPLGQPSCGTLQARGRTGVEALALRFDEALVRRFLDEGVAETVCGPARLVQLHQQTDRAELGDRRQQVITEVRHAPEGRQAELHAQHRSGDNGVARARAEPVDARAHHALDRVGSSSRPPALEAPIAVVSLADSTSLQQGAETLLKEQRVPLSAPPYRLDDLIGRCVAEESSRELLFRPFRKRAQLDAVNRQAGVGRERELPAPRYRYMALAGA